MIGVLALLACRGPDPAETIAVSATGEIGPLGYRIAVDLAAPKAVWAVCTAFDRAEERHLVESSAQVEHHELAILGLRAETDYSCIVHADPWQAEIGFRAGVLPALPPWTVSGQTTGYTVFNTRYDIDGPESSYVVIVDPEGEVRWLYDAGPDLVCDLDVQVLSDRVHMGGGWGTLSASASRPGMYRDVDLQGNILVDRQRPAFGIAFNHHSQRLDDGSTLSLTASEEQGQGREWIGVGIERFDDALGLLWSWSTQALVDEGWLVLPEGELHAPFLSNAAVLVDDPFGEGLWVSSPHRKELWRIDVITGLPTHLLGVHSDWTLFDPEGSPLDVSEWPYVQHDPQLIDGPNGPDTRMILYDNGAGRPGGSYSRAVAYDLDLEDHTAVRLWSFTEPGWFDPIIGGVQALPDGNILIAKGFSSRHTPNATDTSALVEIRPPDEVIWRLRLDDRDWPIYRAERVSDCALFGDAALCPAVAARLAALEGQR